MRYILFLLLFLSCTTTQRNFSSLNDSKTALAPCPKSPNCVSSTALKKKKKLSPLIIKTKTPVAIHQLDSIIQTFPKITLISKSENHLHYTFKTKLGGFTDDVEFLFDESNKLIHFRSASRAGWSDAGANKRRMKKIAKAWTKLNK